MSGAVYGTLLLKIPHSFSLREGYRTRDFVVFLVKILFIYTQLKTLIWPVCADVSLNNIYLSSVKVLSLCCNHDETGVMRDLRNQSSVGVCC